MIQLLTALERARNLAKVLVNNGDETMVGIYDQIDMVAEEVKESLASQEILDNLIKTDSLS